MAAIKRSVEITHECRKEMAKQFNHHIFDSDSLLHCRHGPTFSPIFGTQNGVHETGSGNNAWTEADCIVTFESAIVEIVGIALKIVSLSISVQTISLLPIYNRRMSANVGQCRQCYIRVGLGRQCSRFNRVAIYFSLKFISTSSLQSTVLSSECQPMSSWI